MPEIVWQDNGALFIQMGYPILRDDRRTIVVDVGDAISHVPLGVEIPNIILGETQSLWVVPLHTLVTQSPLLGLAPIAEAVVR